MLAVGSWTVAGASNATAAPSKGATPTSSGIITDNWEREEAFELPWDGAARDGAREGSLDPTWQKSKSQAIHNIIKKKSTNQQINRQTNQEPDKQASKRTSKQSDEYTQKKDHILVLSNYECTIHDVQLSPTHKRCSFFKIKPTNQTNTMVGFLF
jgi:hypothetical protein